MEAPERGALMLVRFIAVALICWTVLEVSLYLVINQHNGTPIQVVPCLIRSLPLLIGIVILIKSKALALWIAEKLDL
jgi:uncharacterized membrane protein HdeD (DUF308 family)